MIVRQPSARGRRDWDLLWTVRGIGDHIAARLVWCLSCRFLSGRCTAKCGTASTNGRAINLTNLIRSEGVGFLIKQSGFGSLLHCPHPHYGIRIIRHLAERRIGRKDTCHRIGCAGIGIPQIAHRSSLCRPAPIAACNMRARAAPG